MHLIKLPASKIFSDLLTLEYTASVFVFPRKLLKRVLSPWSLEKLNSSCTSHMLLKSLECGLKSISNGRSLL